MKLQTDLVTASKEINKIKNKLKQKKSSMVHVELFL